jgi:hypothetical protein
MIQFQVKTAGDGPEKLLKDYFAKLHRQVGAAMRVEARNMRDALRSHVAGEMKVVKKGFLKGFRTKVLDQDPTRLPGMLIGSRIPWSGVHETGASIGGKMLIPINGRVGRKNFKRYVAELMRSGNAYFIKKNGKVILMAENLKENDKPLAGFKRRYRKAEGIKRLKRGADIPIAILVSKVVLRKRLNVLGLVQRRVPFLLKAIEQKI